MGAYVQATEDRAKLVYEGLKEPEAIRLSADVCIKGLQIEFEEGRWVELEDNGFDLLPGEEIIVGAKGLMHGDEKRIKLTYAGIETH